MLNNNIEPNGTKRDKFGYINENFCIGENMIKSKENLGENSCHMYVDKELLYLIFK